MAFLFGRTKQKNSVDLARLVKDLIVRIDGQTPQKVKPHLRSRVDGGSRRRGLTLWFYDPTDR